MLLARRVPGFPHEILVDIVRKGGEVVRELLLACTNINPGDGTAEEATIDLSQVVPIEYRADNVTLFRDLERKPTLAVVVEVQLKVDPVKRRSWPVYVTVVRASNDCDAVLLVIAPDRGVAKWARTRIKTGHPKFSLQPIVISKRNMPRVVVPEVTRRSPELGVLSVLAHRTFDVARALSGVRGITDEQQARLYSDVIMDALPAALRRALEADMERYQYKSEFARRYVAQGLEEGLEKGRGTFQRAVVELARAKLGQLSAEDEAAIRALRDDDALTTLNIGLGQARDVAQARAALDQAIVRHR